MATSPQQFLFELYREYFEDASFLREQRRALLADPEISWRDLEPFEDRLEACLDGLVVGGDLAGGVAQVRCMVGDPGELFAGIGVLCRRGLRALVLEHAQGLGAEDPARLDAVAEALQRECPQEWFEELTGLAARAPGADAQVALAARVAGYRRWQPAAAVLERLAAAVSPRALPDVLAALGHLGRPETRAVLARHLEAADERVSASAARALLLQRDPAARDFCLRAAPAKPWAASLTALSGGKSATPVLRALSQAPPAEPEAILALGLLGDATAAPLLLDFLARGVHPAESAQALELITGASLHETVFIPETAEAAAGREPAPILRPDGKPYGATVKRLALDPKRWEEWWRQRGRQFVPERRYRQGQPCSPEVILATIEAPGSSMRLRQWAADELRIRYGFDGHFEADMPVRAQIAALETARTWVAQNSARFTPGAFYFAGKPIT